MVHKTALTLTVLAFFAGILTFLNSCEQQPYQMGERLFKVHCSNCHLDQGEGLGALIPPLAGSDYLKAHREKLPCIIRYGLQDTITVNGKIYAEQMAGNQILNDIQITNLSNYIYQRFGNEMPPLTFEEVEQILKTCGPK